MAIILYLKWWYGAGWAWILSEYSKKLSSLLRSFSVVILLKTLFSPWKQLYTEATLRNFFQALVDNTVSRVIGFIIRVFVLLGAGIIISLLSVCFFVVLASWAFIPPAIIILPILMLVVGGDGAG